ncbi:MFS transporter [Nocardioides abyssi]|uniref:MFS transporter n=1 Tax=Nocardioides abyssi TaxID=3058370 RepID=A0ABT8EUY0_9ACTN|nr:MFS transporter [Nocardioides abyssi]MDN4161980.1 MFS transporter [Nocardioides abyssi]
MPSPTRTANPRLAIAVLCVGGLTAALTQTLVIPIQSDLPRLLATSPANAAWVVTVTLLAGAVAMPIAGRLADLFGKKRVMVASAALLAFGSALVALSSTLVPVLTGRALQGLAMGFIPVGISMIRQIVPPEMAGSAVAAMSATLGVGGAIGLPLSAWIVEVGDWHALFWVSTALAVVITALTALAIPHVHDEAPGRFDWVGAIGLAVGLVSLLVGVSKATTWGWGDARTLGAMAAGVVVLLVWGAFEMRQAEPLVDLRATAKLPVLMTNIAAVAVGFGMMAQAIVVPQLLQLPEATGYGLGQSILAAGLWMAPGGLVMMLFAPVSGRLISTIGARITLMIGAAVLGGGYLVAYFLMDAPWQLLLVSCILSAGVGIGYAAMPTLILDAVPPREAGAAVGLNALMRSVGTTVSAAVMGTLLTSKTMPVGDGFEIPTEGAFQLCFLVGAIAAFVGVAIAATIPRRRAADVAAAEEPVAAGVSAG